MRLAQSKWSAGSSRRPRFRRALLWTLLLGACTPERCNDDPLFPGAQNDCTLDAVRFESLPSAIDESEQVSSQLTGTVGGGFDCSVTYRDITSTSSNPATATTSVPAATTRVSVLGVRAGSVTIAASGMADFYKNSGSVDPVTQQPLRVKVGSVAVSATQPMTVNRAAGDLDAVIVGLPTGLSADVRLERTATVVTTFPRSGSATDLDPGLYSLNASSVRTEGQFSDTYDPAPVSQSITIVRRTKITASVAYNKCVGSANVVITGLPAGVNGNVRLDRGAGTLDSIYRTLTVTTLVPDLSCDTYTVFNTAVTADGIVYQPIVSTQTFGVARGGTTVVTVVYVAQTGSLGVSITGIEGPADVDVVRGATLIRNLTLSQTLTDLPAAGYTINARPVTGVFYRYVPTPATQNVNVTAGNNTLAFVTYAATTGALNVTITGLPAGLDGRVLVNTGTVGTGTNVATLTRSAVVPLLNAGGYTIFANPVTSNTGVVYLPTPTTTTVNISNGNTANLTVVYAAVVPPTIAMSLSGVPDGGQSQLTINGGTLTSPLVITATGSVATSAQLPAGTYTVTGTDVTVGSKTYRQITIPQTFVVTAGEGNQAVVVPFYLAISRFRLAVNLAVLADPQLHKDFVQMFASATLNEVWTWASPTALPVITVSGGAPWINVSGARNTDGSATLTGSGTAAGFANVAARLTGMFSVTGDLSGGVLQLGSSTPPTGLPGGPITYTILGAATPGSVP